MPTLPTLTINDQAIWNRLMAVFESDPEKYKAWLKQALQDQVRAVESRNNNTSNMLDGAV